MSVAVLIPTLRRPDALARALHCAFAQAGVAERLAEIVVVDNAPEGSARATVERLASKAPAPLRYVHAPRPGVATARNAGLREVSADHVAFLDDDETAGPGWLAALLAAHERLGADVTFGPVRGRAPDAPARDRPQIERFFSRLRAEPTGLIGDHDGCGCGNSIMRRATALVGPDPFDVRADAIGGEDDRLFGRIAGEGGRFAWAADAWVDEEVPAARATAGYVLRRAYAMGQGPTRICLRATPPDWMGALGWVLVGLAQFGLHGAAAAVLRGFGRPAWLAQADRASRGLGKVVWWPELAFYGGGAAAAEARPSVAVSPSGLGSASLVSSATKITQVKSL